MTEVPESVLHLGDRLSAELIAHAIEGLPNEACGLLVGRGRRVDRFVPVTNAAAAPDRYTLDPEQHYRTMIQAESEALEILGVFHSHPVSAAEPSATDISLAGEPEWVWVIAGDVARSPVLRAWRIVAGQSSEIHLA